MLVGPPVRLRPFRDGDVDLVVRAGRDPLIPLITTVPADGTVEDARAFLDRQARRLAAGIGYSFAVARVVDDVAVGQVGVWLLELDQRGATVGYWMGREHRRQGFAAAALDLATGWALGLDGVDRADLYVEPWNEGSWRTAERCGYRRQELLRQWQQVGEERRDMFRYSRSAD